MTQKFDNTTQGYKEATQYLKIINKSDLIDNEKSNDGYTIVALANSLFEKHIITQEDIYACWQAYYFTNYLIDILNGEYDVNEAKEDLKSLIATKYDNRVEDD